MNELESFLGTGWSFPPSFNKAGGVEMVSNDIDIKQALQILLSTSLGERIMLPKYGCDLNDYLFSSISDSNIYLIREQITSAIINYEPRVTVNNVDIDQSQYLDGILSILVDYSVITTNTRFNLVFPYYKLEGTDIPQLYFENFTLSKED
jgi:phage baseplate assembly protein W